VTTVSKNCQVWPTSRPVFYRGSLKFDTWARRNSTIYRERWAGIYINYSNTTKNNTLFTDVSASRRKPLSGLTSGAGRQYVKACPIRGSTGSSPRLDSCCHGSSSNTMRPGPRPTRMPSFILTRPTVWPQYTNVTDTTDRQRSTVLQTVAQKRIVRLLRHPLYIYQH